MKRINFQATLQPYGYERVESIPSGFIKVGTTSVYDELLGFVLLEGFEDENDSYSYIRYTYELHLGEGCNETRSDCYKVWDFESYDLYTAAKMARDAEYEFATWEVPFHGR